jgi:hypothetical protein
MFRRYLRLASLCLPAVGFAGCEGITATEPDDTFFVASIEGAIATEFEGSGRFVVGTDARRPAAPPMFSLFSAGRGASATYSFQLFRRGAELPGVGTYSLAVPVRDAREIQANFSRTGPRGETLEMYTAYEGELEITLSTPERLEGTFRMTAYLSGRQVGPGQIAGSLGRQPDSPTVQVSGRFAADRASTVAFAGMRLP